MGKILLLPSPKEVKRWRYWYTLAKVLEYKGWEIVNCDWPIPNTNFHIKTSELIHLKIWIDWCDLYIADDTGAMHYANICGKKGIALFGNTCEVKNGPVNGSVVVYEEVKCRPCYEHGKFKCVHPEPLKCLEIPFEAVMNEINKIFNPF